MKGKEKEYWNSIDPSFMSEESSHESEGELVMHRHTPVFRSEGYRQKLFLPLIPVYVIFFNPGLNKLIESLDKRHTKQRLKDKSSTFKAFPRVVCSPVKRDPRSNAPAWAVKPMYRQSEASCSTNVEQPRTSTPLSASSSRALPSRHLSFSTVSTSGEVPEDSSSDSECDLDEL